jgi:hypothetical protein
MLLTLLELLLDLPSYESDAVSFPPRHSIGTIPVSPLLLEHKAHPSSYSCSTSSVSPFIIASSSGRVGTKVYRTGALVVILAGMVRGLNPADDGTLLYDAGRGAIPPKFMLPFPLIPLVNVPL